MKKTFLKIFLLLIIISPFVALPQTTLAQTEPSFDSVEFKPSVTIPGSDFEKGKNVPAGHLGEEAEKDPFGIIPTEIWIVTSDLLGKYIISIYDYAIGVGITLAVVMIAVGGVIWLTSAGSPDKISQAKSYITGATLGVILLVGAYVILNSINTDLTKLKPIETILLTNIVYGCCQIGETASNMTQPDCEAQNGAWLENYSPNSDYSHCEANGCCKIATSASEQQRQNIPRLSYSELIYQACETQCCPEGRPPCQIMEEVCQDCQNLVGSNINSASSCQTTNNDVCFNIIGSGLSSRPVFEQGANCSRLSECSGVVVDCAQKTDGKACDNYSGSDYCYCYGGKPFFGKGTMGESCGAQGGSKCYALNNGEQTNSQGCDKNNHWYNDFVSSYQIGNIFFGSGRMCKEPLACCYYVAP